MKIRFLGPLGKVTGSCAWMRDELRGWNFLIDCGIQQGEATAEQWNKCDWPFDPASLQFVLLTHAHMDHCGLLPMLYKRGFSGTVYCARETAEIAKILLKDAARLGGVGYSEADVDLVKMHEPGTDRLFGKYHPVGQDLFASFYRTGHVVGAISVVIHWGAPRTPEQRSIVFSGDLGPNEEDKEKLPFLRHRMGVPPCDFAVVESTYGATVRMETDAAQRRDHLRGLLDRSIDHRGVLVIPAFALGRTQDVLFDLHWIVAENPERYASLPMHLDSPAARKIHATILEALQRTEANGRNGKVRPLWLGKQMFRWFGLDQTDPAHIERMLEICRLTLKQQKASTSTHSPKIGNALARSWNSVLRASTKREAIAEELDGQAGVIVVSSGSADGGPAANWLPRLLGSSRNTVAFAGYCSAGTVGGQLLDVANLAQDQRNRLSACLSWPDGKTFAQREIRAGVEKIDGYSAHADQGGLLNWLFGSFNGQTQLAGKLIFIQHGADEQRLALELAIKARATQADIPLPVIRPTDPSLWFDLDNNAGVLSRKKELDDTRRELKRLQMEIERLQERERALTRDES